jgi:hypothetical protein
MISFSERAASARLANFSVRLSDEARAPDCSAHREQGLAGLTLAPLQASGPARAPHSLDTTQNRVHQRRSAATRWSQARRAGPPALDRADESPRQRRLHGSSEPISVVGCWTDCGWRQALSNPSLLAPRKCDICRGEPKPICEPCHVF